MRVRTNIIIEESILAKIDAIAGEKPKRAAVIETALREYIAREESKAPVAGDIEVTDKKPARKRGSQKVSSTGLKFVGRKFGGAEIMQQLKIVEPLITVYDLEATPDDGNIYELFEGELSVAKAPSLKHQEIIGNFATILNSFLWQNPIGRIWITPGVIFDEYNSAIPDLVFVAKDRLDRIASGIHIVGAPDLAIEIMSPGTENVRRDQIVKRQTYARFGVKEYWVVEPLVEIIEISRLQKNVLASVGVFRNANEILSPLLPDLSFRVEDVFRK